MYPSYKAATDRVFISFDYDHDRHYRYLLSAQVQNPKFQLDFFDATPTEIQTNSVSRIQGVLTTKIRNATHTLVLVGRHANDFHHRRFEIGERNWQWWEIKQSIAEQKKLVVVKIDRNYVSPDPLLNVNAKWVYGFNVAEIQKAIEGY